MEGSPLGVEGGYRHIRVIGQGAFGRAVLVEKLEGDMAGQKFVIKQINLSMMSEAARKEAVQEVKVWEVAARGWWAGARACSGSGGRLGVESALTVDCSTAPMSSNDVWWAVAHFPSHWRA